MIICFCLLQVTSAGGQSTSFFSEKSLNIHIPYTIQYWNTENGLPQGSVVNITQTKDGYLWFSTFFGLVRFDGKKFFIYNNSNTGVFKGAYCEGLVAGRNDNLWLTESNRLLVYRNGEFHLTGFSSKSTIRDLCMDDRDSLLIGDSEGNIYYFNNGLQTLLISIPGHYLNDLYYKKGKLYIASSKGLFIFSKGKLHPVKGTERWNILNTTVTDDETIWINTGTQVVKINKHGQATTLKGMPPLSTINSLYSAKDGHLWAATNTGIYIVWKSKIVKKLTFNDGLSANRILCVYEDMERNIWAGSFNNGINLLKPKTFITYSEQEGVKESIAGLLELNKDSLLISDGSIFSGGKIKQSGYPHARTLLKTRGQTLWMGGLGLDKKIPGQRATWSNAVPELSGYEINCMIEDDRSRIWIGTHDGLYVTNRGKIITTHLSSTRVNQLIQDHSKHIWAATSKGLLMWNGNQWQRYGEEQGLPPNEIRSVYEDSEGTIWAGSIGAGLIRYKSGKLFHYKDIQGLLDKNVWCIIEDNYGRLWMSSNNGIYAASKDDLNSYADGKTVFVSIKHFGKTDGIRNTEFNGGFQPACVKTSDGRLWFPGVGGVSVVDPALVSFTITNPDITIDNVRIDNEKINFSQNRLIEFDRTKNLLEIEYAVPVFTAGNDVFFQYGLEGYDDQWLPPTQNRKVSYFNLPSGQYVFKVRLYGNHDKRINKETFINVTVPRPFWETPLFIVSGSVIVVLCALTAMYFRIRYVRRQVFRRSELEKRHHTLELKALQAQMNPHFIFNCLNSIKYFITIKDDASARKYLNIFSKLLRKFLEQSKSNYVTLEEEIELLTLYIEMEQLRFENSFNFILEIDPAVNPAAIEIPGMLFQPYVENAIKHGLLNLDGKGELKMIFRRENGTLTGIVDDNGIGRAKAAELKKKSGQAHQPMGMQITSEKINVLNLINKMNISVETLDKVDEGGVAHGTKVIVRIPHEQLKNGL